MFHCVKCEYTCIYKMGFYVFVEISRARILGDILDFILNLITVSISAFLFLIMLLANAATKKHAKIYQSF